MANIALAGLGTVGGEVLQMLVKSEGMAGLTPVAASARRERDNLPNSVRFCVDVFELVQMPEVDIIAEMIGGEGEPAYGLVKAALAAGKHVVTANKALIAHHGQELAALAEEKGVALNFESAVCAGVPVVRILRDYCPSGAVEAVDGILNGTCNYILSTMEESGRALGSVLKEAQEQGYAEAEPSLDIDGIDAAHKIAILAALAFGERPELAAVDVDGIRAIQQVDIAMAREMGFAVRLVAHASQGESLWVQPVLVAQDSRLARLDGTHNGVRLAGQGVQFFLEGAGAGARPTAYGVLADLASIAAGNIRPAFGRPAGELRPHNGRKSEGQKNAWFMRLNVKDRPGVMADITSALAKSDISIARLVQNPTQSEGDTSPVPLALMSHPASRKSAAEAVKSLEALPALVEEPLLLRVLPEKNPE